MLRPGVGADTPGTKGPLVASEQGGDMCSLIIEGHTCGQVRNGGDGDIPGKSLGMGSADPVSFLLNSIIMTHNRCSDSVY